jgi:hypothetical protein
VSDIEWSTILRIEKLFVGRGQELLEHAWDIRKILPGYLLPRDKLS